jgi:hypothetical protein
LLPGHVAPERLYLDARWASLAPYAAVSGLLSDILPIAAGIGAGTLRRHALRVAERAEAELAEERPWFIDGCPADWGSIKKCGVLVPHRGDALEGRSPKQAT